MDWSVPTPLDYFAALVAQDDGFALTEAAVAVGQIEHPGLDTQSVLADLDRLAARLRSRLPPDAAELQRLRLLNRYFFHELGFAGNVNDFYSSDNSRIDRVLHTRRGIPITLAVVFLELAEQIGLKAKGLSFPGHFLILLKLPLGDAVLDPLTGQSLSRGELEERLEPYLERDEAGALEAAHLQGDPLAPFLRPASGREIVARMLRNLVSIYRDDAALPHLLQVQQRLVLLQPTEWDWRRDRGDTLARLGQTDAAIEDLCAYLRHEPHARDRRQVTARIDALREAGPPRWH